MFQMCMRQNVTDCTDHLAHRCPGVVEKDRVDLSLFMQSNIEAFSTEEDEEDLVLCSFTFEPNPQNGCSGAGKREGDREPLHGDSQEALLPQPLREPLEEELDLALIVEDVCRFTQETQQTLLSLIQRVRLRSRKKAA